MPKGFTSKLIIQGRETFSLECACGYSIACSDKRSVHCSMRLHKKKCKECATTYNPQDIEEETYMILPALPATQMAKQAKA